MQKKQLINIVLFILAASVVGYLLLDRTTPKQTGETEQSSKSFRDATYVVDGVPLTFVNGVVATEAAPGSATNITTSYFGNEAVGDLNGDGIDDVAFLLVQDGGGSGSFFYVVAALKTSAGWQGSDAVFLGDRVAPQTTQIENGIITVNYADRAPGEPMAAAPSVGKSLRLKLDPNGMRLGEVVQNFEGEADPSRMTLEMKKWQWTSAVVDGKTVTPKFPEKFNLSFKMNGEFSASTDCNGVGGTYKASGSSLAFSKMISTMMFCEGSQEGEFTKVLTNVGSYHFTSKGELVFKLANGTATFK